MQQLTCVTWPITAVSREQLAGLVATTCDNRVGERTANQQHAGVQLRHWAMHVVVCSAAQSHRSNACAHMPSPYQQLWRLAGLPSDPLRAREGAHGEAC
jgi:hypothetical protein